MRKLIPLTWRQVPVTTAQGRSETRPAKCLKIDVGPTSSRYESGVVIRITVLRFG